MSVIFISLQHEIWSELPAVFTHAHSSDGIITCLEISIAAKGIIRKHVRKCVHDD